MQRKNKKKNYQNKKKNKKRVNFDNNEENIHEKIILQDVEHDDDIDLNEVDQLRRKYYYFGSILCIITSEFNQFKRASYTHKLI